MHALIGVARVAEGSMENIFTAGMPLLGHVLVMVDVREVWHSITCFLIENRARKASSSMISKDHMVRDEKSSLCAKLAGNVKTHARLHVGPTIS